ncbi:MAG: asparagine--tRNA ligase [Rhabdochlamydiaceae bacterium]
MSKVKISQLSDLLMDQHITLKGWIRTVRQQKAFTFIELNDGSTLSNLQIIFDQTSPNYLDIIPLLSTGASICAQGILTPSVGQKQKWELKATLIELIGACPVDDYPLQKKRHSFEFLRTIGHLRARTNTQGAVNRIRNALSFATHTFFQERGFLYIQTPIITTSDAEGAGEQFLVTTLDLNNLPKTQDNQVDFSKDFFHKKASLTVSGQLNAEAYACALSDVYTFGPTFRAENSHTSRHLAEFWMIEPEMAFANLKDNMECVESYIKHVVSYVLKNCAEDLHFFDEYIEKGLVKRLENVVSHSFAHMSYTDAINILQKAPCAFEFPVKWGVDLQSEHERYLAEQYCQKPVILTDYPSDIKAFYMKENPDGKTVAAMDLLVPKIGELVGGSQREDDHTKLRAKMIKQGLNPEDYEWYLQLRHYGSVPHAGFGVGFERLVLFTTGMENIRDVIPFPRYPGHAEY